MTSYDSLHISFDLPLHFLIIFQGNQKNIVQFCISTDCKIFIIIPTNPLVPGPVWGSWCLLERPPPEMPYLIVRESYINTSCLVDGLPLNEIRLITEKSSSPSDLRDERNRRVEFSTPAFNLLNALEQIGYKVVTSSSFVTGPKKFDTKDFIWTLYRPSCEIEA